MATKVKRPRFDAFHTFTVMNALAIFGLWLIHTFIAERTAPTAFLLYLPPQPLLILPFVGALWALFCKRRKLFVVQLVTPLFTIFALCGFQIPNIVSTHNGESVKIVTWNVLRAGSGSNVEKLAQTLKSLNADVICLQETRGPNAKNLRTALQCQFPKWNFASAGDVMTLSRFPLMEQKQYAAPPPSGRFILDTTFQIGSQKLRVLNTHWTTSPLPSEKKSLPGGSPQMRSLQAKQLFQLTKNSSVPFVIAGDFNNPPRGKIYAWMAQRWQDAFAVRGLGFGGTYPARFPLLRIDYIWASHNIRVLNCHTTKTLLSDHRALVCEFDVSS